MKDIAFVLIVGLCSTALGVMAQTLQPVTDGGVNWWPIGGMALVAVAVFVGVVIYRNHGGWKPDGDIVDLRPRPSDPAANSELINAISATHELMRELVAKMQPPDYKIGGVSGWVVPPPETPVAVGKAGQPGTFTIEVTGDPATDMAAINAQYFG